MKLTFKNMMKTKNKWGGFENNCQGDQNGERMIKYWLVMT